MRISDWSSDVCSSDLRRTQLVAHVGEEPALGLVGRLGRFGRADQRLEQRTQVERHRDQPRQQPPAEPRVGLPVRRVEDDGQMRDDRKADRGVEEPRAIAQAVRSEEHTSELQSLMRISYAVFCLKKKKKKDSI